MTIKKIAFVGLGAMGFPMAKRLCSAGFELKTAAFKGDPRYKDSERTKILEEMGAAITDTFAESAKDVDLVITILPEDEQVKAVLLNRDFVEAVGSGTIILEMSSCSPQAIKDVNGEYMKKGVKVIDAPVSGGTPGAENGQLTILGAGDKEAFDSLEPVFKVLATSVFHVGAVGAGKALKVINQMLAGVNMVAVAEAHALARKLEVNPEVMYDVIKASAGYSYVFSKKYRKLVYNDFSLGFKLSLMRKDMRIALKSGENIPMPLARLAYNFYLMAGSPENDDMDYSILSKLFTEE